MSLVKATFQRDLLLLYRNSGDWLNPLMFFLMVIALFPMAVDPDPKFLGKIAGGVMWVAALLATLLSLDSLFKSDVVDGSLEQFAASGEPLWTLGLVKAFVHWLSSGLPLVVVAPLIGVMLSLPADAYLALTLSLLLGTPVLSLIGAVGASLTASLRSGGLLLSLLVLPLYLPVLIFAASAVQQASLGLSVTGQLAMLGAFLALAVAVAPIAIGASLQLSVSR